MGLTYWKSFGASTIVHDFYEVETANYYKLDGCHMIPFFLDLK
jgi:hypothetical protein